MNARDITALPENTRGEDYIIGDVHGSAEQLQMILNILKPDDRLFIVGDLADRGLNSLDVFTLLLENQANRQNAGLPQQVYAVRGNHEDLFLNYYHVKNNPLDPSHQLFMLNGGAWAKTLSEEEAVKIADFISGLPYIYHISGAKPFNVVHADMPFNDKELFARMRSKNLSLSAEEKTYATWARTVGEIRIKDCGRTSASIITYCGHTIGEGVRKKTNHVDLDIQTFSYQIMNLVGHHRGNCILAGEVPAIVFPNGKSFQSIQAEINAQLDEYQKCCLTKVVRKISDEKELNAEAQAIKIDEFLSEMSAYSYRNQRIPIKESQERYIRNLAMIAPILNDAIALALAYWVANNKLHFLRIKSDTGKKSFVFFSSSELSDPLTWVGKAITILGHAPQDIIRQKKRRHRRQER